MEWSTPAIRDLRGFQYSDANVRKVQHYPFISIAIDSQKKCVFMKYILPEAVDCFKVLKR